MTLHDNTERSDDSLRTIEPKADCSSIPPSKDKSIAVLRIEQGTYRIRELLNARDWTHPDWESLVAPDYEVKIEHFSTAPIKGKDACLAACKKYMESNPDYYCEIFGLSIDVDERAGTARAWMNIKAMGHKPDLQQENIGLAYWRREKGRWATYKQESVRGLMMINDV